MGAYYGTPDSITLGPNGSSVVAGAASASTSVPNTADGNRAKLVVLSATGSVHIKLTKGAGTCTVNDFMLPAFGVITVNTTQYDTISYLQRDVAPVLNITPLEM